MPPRVLFCSKGKGIYFLFHYKIYDDLTNLLFEKISERNGLSVNFDNIMMKKY